MGLEYLEVLSERAVNLQKNVISSSDKTTNIVTNRDSAILLNEVAFLQMVSEGPDHPVHLHHHITFLAHIILSRCKYYSVSSLVGELRRYM